MNLKKIRPHLIMPKRLWLLECTMWVVFGWFVILIKNPGGIV